MTDDCYITTPIYYVNDEPHIGTAHTTVLADVLARFRRLQGKSVFFLTGTDEHGQKVRDAALENGIDPKTQADRMVVRFQESWRDLDISHDDFIRTTESRHTRLVESVLRGLWDKGEIYFGEYEGWYCVPDERFWTDKDLADGRCPDCGRSVERITEPNYFFRMGKYQDWLIGYVNDHPEIIQPEHRRNEVLGYLRRPLDDLCITRPVKRVLYNASEALRLVSVLLHSVMPGKTRELWHSLGWTPGSDLSEGLDWGGLLPGSRVTLGLPLFPRIDQRPNLLPGWYHYSIEERCGGRTD